MNKILILTLIAFILGACNDHSYQKNENRTSVVKTDSRSQTGLDSTMEIKQSLAVEPKKSVAEA